MSQDELKSLRNQIEKEGADWTPTITSVSRLTAEEQDQMLGLSVTKAELRSMEQAIRAETKLAAMHATPAAPVAIDWRNNGGDWTTPITDQKSCGSCVAFGVVATVEARINIVCKEPNKDKDLSEAHLFYCGCGNCCSSGWNFPPALDFSRDTGIGLETSFPYTPGDQPCKAGIQPYIKISSWNKVLTMDDRRHYLSTKGPLVAGMAVYSDFFSYSSGIYRQTSQDLRGYHAICVVGYDDNEECWICKNSWGPNWGDSGWFKIAYGHCQIDTTFPFYNVELEKCPNGDVHPCRKYVLYLGKVLREARSNRRLRACLMYYICRQRRPWRFFCMRRDLMEVARVRYILKKCPQYHRPFCLALSRT